MHRAAPSRFGVPVAVCLLTLSADALAAPLFSEQWEGGVGGWTAFNLGPIDLVSDPAVATRTFQRETIGGAGGRIIASTIVPIAGNSKYCISAWIRGGVGTCPFVGIETNEGARWLIGQAGEPDQYGGTVTAVTPDGAWHWYGKEFTTNAGETWLQVKDEMYVACAVLTADFDDIEVNAGACAPSPRLAYGDTVYCKDAAPVATTANACLACDGDNGGGTSHACPAAANPYCKTDGSCGKCARAADCAGRTGKFCSPSSGACVATCTADAQCPNGVCDNATNICVQCTMSSHCKAPTPVCNTATHTCAAASGGADGGMTSSSSSSGSPSTSSGSTSGPDGGSGGGDVASAGGGCACDTTGGAGNAGFGAAVAVALAALFRRRR